MDISTIADLLDEFVSAEREILNKQDIKHPTTIGVMYEGLTETVLKKSLFEGLNLRVLKNSFITGCATEFDVMLVEGDGEQIPYTERYKYRPEQVIAVIQVKKNLYSKDIKEGFSNLQFLVDNYDPLTSENFIGRLFRDAFKTVCRKDITSYEAGELTKHEHSVFTTLKIEAVLPVRIIWGYNGFACEYSFRESFSKYLEQNVTTDLDNIIPGFGPHNFPSLIFSGQYSMIKHNGMPFGSTIKDENWWPFYSSTSYNTTKLFLETIWTRLSYKFEHLPMKIFGEDLTMEPVNRFLDCRLQRTEGNYGWQYSYFELSKSSLKQHTEALSWEPAELDIIQHAIIGELCMRQEIDLAADQQLEFFVTRNGLYKSLDDFLEKLKSTELVFFENNKLKLLTDNCRCAVLPNGKFVAGENKSGRFTRWFNKEIAKLQQQKNDPADKLQK